MRFPILACLLLFPIAARAQESASGEVARLVSELGADDAIVRERASERLYELRKTSEAVLRAHRGADEGVRARIGRVLRRIDERHLLDAELVLESVVEMPGGLARGLAGSPADDLVATSAPWGGVQLWDVASLRAGPRLETGDRPARALAFEPSGKRLAVAAGELAIWSVEGARETVVEAGGAGAVVWSADGETIAYVSGKGEVVLWEVAAARAKQRFDLSKNGVRALAASADGRLAAGCEDGTVVEISMETGKETGRSQAGGPVRALAALSDGPFVTALADGRVLWGKVEVRVSGAPWSLATNRNGKRIAVGYEGGLRVWEADGTPVPHTAQDAPLAVTVLFHPSAGRLVALDVAGAVVTWRAPDQPTRGTHRYRFVDLCWTRDNRHIACWGDDLAFCEVQTGRTRVTRGDKTREGMPAGTYGVPGPGQDEIVYHTFAGSRIWSAAKGEAVRDFSPENDGDAITPERTSPDGSLRVATDRDDGVWLRPVLGGRGTGTAVTRAERYLLAASWSPDSQRLAFSASFRGDRSASIGSLIVDRQGKRLFENVENGTSGSVALDPGGRWFVWTVGTWTRRIRLTDFAEDSQADVPVIWFQFLDDHTGFGVNGPEVSLWFTPDFRPSRTWNLGLFDAWALSPDGKRLATLRPGAVRIHRIQR